MTDEGDKQAIFTYIKSQINSLIMSEFSSSKLTTLTLAARFLTLLQAITQLHTLPGFPIHSVNNYWRSYYISSSPPIAGVVVVNTKTIVASPPSNSTFAIIDLYTSKSPPALPASGCGMEDKDISEAEILEKRNHDTILQVVEVQSGLSGVSYSVEFTNNDAMSNTFTPVCCLRVISNQWHVVGRASEQNTGQFVCSFAETGIVSLLYYSQNLFNLSIADFAFEVYFFTENQLKDFMAIVRRVLFTHDTDLYKEIFSEAKSCMDVLDSIFLTMENLRAAFHNEAIEEESDTARRYFFECLEINYFSEDWAAYH